MCFEVATAAAGTPVVEVIGGNHEPVFGYYVEYTVDGAVYRSDEAGSSMNAAAWRLMSAEDRAKVTECYSGFGQTKRKGDFGTGGEAAIVDWVNEKQGWSALYEKLKDNWMKADFADLQSRFSQDHRSDYFTGNLPGKGEGFVPECLFDQNWDSKMQTMYEAELKFFAMACEAYDALERYNSFHRSAAVQVISGELIQIITDKILVPRITPASAIDLSGTMYGVVKEGIGALLDNVNNITGASDYLIAQTVGERAKWDAVKVMQPKIDYMIAQDQEIIRNAMSQVKALKQDIEDRWRENNTAKTQQLEIARGLDNARKAPVLEIPIADNPDPAIENNNEVYATNVLNYAKTQHAKEDLYNSLKKEEHETDSAFARRKEEAKLAWDQARTNTLKEIERCGKYNAQIFDQAVQACRSWYAEYDARYSSLTNSRPQIAYQGLHPDYYNYLAGGTGNAPFELSPGDVSSLLGYVRQEVAAINVWLEASDAWYSECRSFCKDAREAYSDISAKIEAVDEGSTYRQYVTESEWPGLLGESGSSYNTVFADAERVISLRFDALMGTPAEDARYWNDVIAKRTERCDEFSARYEEYKNKKSEDRRAFLSLVADYDLAVVAYWNAYATVSNLVAALPDYLADQRIDPSSGGAWIDYNPDSILGRMFRSNPPTGTAADAANIRAETKSLLVSYNSAMRTIDAAEERLKEYEVQIGKVAWAVSGTPEAALYDRLCRPFVVAIPGFSEWHTIVCGIYEDFAWMDTAATLVDCYAQLVENREGYSVPGEDDSGYNSLKRRINSALDRVGYQRNGASLRVVSPPGTSLSVSPGGCYARGIAGYMPWENDFYADLIVPVIAGIEAERELPRWSYSIDNGGVTITGVASGDTSGRLELPAEIDGLPVVAVADWAFSGCYQTETVVIPASVANISPVAFGYCGAINCEVAAANPSFGSIGGLLCSQDGKKLVAGFGGNPVLQSGITEIVSHAFSCKDIVTLRVPASLTMVGEDPFYGCSGPLTVIVDAGDLNRVRQLFADAGVDVEGIEFIDVLEAEWSYRIEVGAAVITEKKTPAVGTVEIPAVLGGAPVTAIDEWTFQWCEELESVVFPSGLKTVGGYAFTHCPLLTSVNLPSGVASIGMGAFAWCASLTEVSIPGSVTNIDSQAFAGCGNLKTVYVDEGDIERVRTMLQNSGSFKVFPSLDFVERTSVYVVRFLANGGAGGMSDQLLRCNKAGKLPRCSFAPPKDRHFAGWRCSNGKLYDDGVLVFNLEGSGGTVTMTAIWK